MRDVIILYLFVQFQRVRKNHRDQDFIDKVGKQILKIRKEKGFSQERLATNAGLELRQFQRIENGEVNTSISSLSSIAKALDVNPKDLLDFLNI